MELNNIKLNDVILGGLYQKVLVETDILPSLSSSKESPQPKPQQAITPTTEIKFLGNNARNILILVNSSQHTYLPENQLEFLTKILGACKLNIGDVAIVNTANHPDTQAIINTTQPSQIILFGVQTNTNNIPSVIAPSISELITETAEAKAMKSKLWTSLKQMFGV